MDIYQEVTNRIIEQLEGGIIPWQKPWSGLGCSAISHTSGKPYSLLNQFLLGKAGEWLTFNQVKKEGGRVKKGAKSSIVVFWKFIEQEDKDDAGEIVIKSYPILKYFSVFHIDQCEGIKKKYENPEDRPTLSNDDMCEEADEAVGNYCTREKVGFRRGVQDEAYYSPLGDYVSVPVIEQFQHVAEYYSTIFHELIHSTGHPSRLNRIHVGANAMFGSQDYSKEELVAEIGAATLCTKFKLDSTFTNRNSAAYVQGWLKALKNDKKLIISAAGKAEKAVKFFLNEKDNKEGE